MSIQIKELKCVLEKAAELYVGVERNNRELLNENTDLKAKYINLKNSISKTLNPIDAKYDFTNAPNFLKLLQKIETTEDKIIEI